MVLFKYKQLKNLPLTFFLSTFFYISVKLHVRDVQEPSFKCNNYKKENYLLSTGFLDTMNRESVI